MGLSEIIKRIDGDSKEIANDILSEAERKVDEIINTAKNEAEKRKKEILEGGEKQATLKKQRIIADARLRARKIKWDVKEKLVIEVLNKAREKIAEVRKDGYSGRSYAEILRGLIKEGAISAGGGDMQIILTEYDSKCLTKKDLDALAKELKSNIGECKFELSETTLVGLGGPIVRTRDGRVEVNNTIERRIERFSDLLRAEITKEIFGG